MKDAMGRQHRAARQTADRRDDQSVEHPGDARDDQDSQRVKTGDPANAIADLIHPARLTEVVDIGANPIDGVPPYKKLLERRLCHVTGFEPQAEALAQLNAVKSDLEHYLPYVVGSSARTTLHRCRYSGWTSLLVPDPAALDVFASFQANATVVEEIPVTPQPLDRIKEITHVDFLKIDVQGAELDCLQSGIEKIAAAAAIHLEISFVPLYVGQPCFGEVDVFLRSLGFVPHLFASIKKWPISPLLLDNNPTKPLNQLLEADMVYVKNFVRADSVGSEALKHAALIAHYCYDSFDLAAKYVSLLEDRQDLPAGSTRRYVALLAEQLGLAENQR